MAWVAITPAGRILSVSFFKNALFGAGLAAGWESVRTGKTHRVVRAIIETI